MPEDRNNAIHPNPAADRTPDDVTTVERPFGLKAIIGLLIAQALLAIVFVVLLVTEPLTGWSTVSADLTLRELISQVIGTLITPVLVVGLWRYRRWAWYGIMIFLAFNMIVAIVYFVIARAYYVSMFLNVLMVFYLNQQEVKELFVKKDPQSPPSESALNSGPWTTTRSDAQL